MLDSVTIETNLIQLSNCILMFLIGSEMREVFSISMSYVIDGQQFAKVQCFRCGIFNLIIPARWDCNIVSPDQLWKRVMQHVLPLAMVMPDILYLEDCKTRCPPIDGFTFSNGDRVQKSGLLVQTYIPVSDLTCSPQNVVYRYQHTYC